MAGRKANYKIRCLKDGKIFDNIDELCEYYGFTKDQVAYRIDHIKDYKDGYNYERVIDNTEALKTTENIDSAAFVEKFGDKTVPLPGYEGKYTISTKGVITNVKNYGTVVPVKTDIIVRNRVILHNLEGRTQTHKVENLMKKAFGDPAEETTE